ncbi:putative MFS monosaccharide transporter [Protomyces lactucae-debilis]|uniref:Putative MFS monosaccharide transporter n=1 Tax=Protomyces lactucae-debilis TaxID=2754530 RepID=A0A1Y2FUV3_PROLT|nr:putative MFS monosaccharide transporter [Protomyces lactucae-debilis]ORY86956.1 putative MFS monosaccharide transporter [Protomyces lactucae-debilis]
MAAAHTSRSTSSLSSDHTRGQNEDRFANTRDGKVPPGEDPKLYEKERITAFAIIIALVAAVGGFIFGYDTGQISGFLQMRDFRERFGEPTVDATGGVTYGFSYVREGAIVGLLSVGTLIGCTTVGWIADSKLGRKYTIMLACFIFCVGNVIQIACVQSWVQMAIGRLIAGLGVGQLSVLVPLYQSETAPKRIRGALVATYQLFITFGILVAYAINAGTETLDNDQSWRITIGIAFVFAFALAGAMIFMPESPRYSLAHNKEEQAVLAMERIRGVSRHNIYLESDLNDMRAAMNAEAGHNSGFGELVHGKPKIFYRVLLGVALQGFQQLTGANYFFYYGTTIFNSVGIENSFITSIILGAVNFGCTLGGIGMYYKFGRRWPLILGGIWMCICFLVFASIGITVTVPGSGGLADAQPTETAGYVMIVFACLFILGFSTTWSTGTWVVTSELFPTHIRAKAVGFTTGGNWFTNFLLAFFTPFISGDIGFAYGYVFAGCNLLGAATVYFFLYETKGLSLEEVNQMYGDSSVKPWNSSKWTPKGRADRGDYTAEEPKRDASGHVRHLETTKAKPQPVV